MFNGLIKDLAKVASFDGYTLSLFSKLQPTLGSSIAVNGACLSVSRLFDGGFELQLSPESRASLALENLKDRVHIEPAMRLGDPIDGHILQGHIDAIGKIIKIEQKSGSKDIYISTPAHIKPYICTKGSIAVDGVSLTVSELLKDSFRLSIIPITLKDTLLDEYRLNRRVNLESDILARYLARIISCDKDKSLERFGYLY